MPTRPTITLQILLAGLAWSASAWAQQHRLDNAALAYWQGFAVMGDHLKREDLNKLADHPVTGPVSAEAAAGVDLADDALACLRRGAAVRRCDFGIDYDAGPGALLPHLGKARQLARIAVLRANLNFDKGKPAEAMEDYLAAVTLARHVGTDGVLISLLVGFSVEGWVIEALAERLPSLDAKTADVLHVRWDAIVPPGTAQAAIRAERSLFLDWFVAKLRSTVDGKAEVKRVLEMAGANQGVLAGADTKQLLTYCEAARPLYEEMIAGAALGPEKLEAAWREIEVRLKAPEMALARMMLPGVVRIRQTEMRYQARAAMFTVALDMVRRGADALGQRRDPFGDGPFAYRKLDGGFELESKLRFEGKPVTLGVGRGK
jgi:hypothetical protein